MTHDCDNPLKAYREALMRHGPGFAATLWGSREGQQLRFDVLIDLAGFDGCVVVDAGCGAGDFAERLIERKVDFKRYVGIDALPELIECAKRRGLDRCEFIMANLLADPTPMVRAAPDFVCFCGTLNTMEEPTARALVETAYGAAAQGVVFNFLSNRPHARWSGRDLSPARRFDTLDWLKWALSLSSRASFTQDYLDGHDATMMIRHDG